MPPAGRDAIAWQGRLDAEVGSDTFGPALGLQLSTLARDGVQHARLHLNPVELGPITVKIALDGAGARVDFQADAAFTRAAIESSLPSLAGAMREAGLTLTGGGVFQQPQDRPSNGGGAGNGSAANPRHDDRREAEPLPGPMRPISIRRGLVDLVA